MTVGSLEDTIGPRLGADYAFGPCQPGLLEHAGIDWVFRYLCNSPDRGLNSKLLTRTEADELTEWGIDIVSNWQLNKDDWRGGEGAGREFARRARQAHYEAGGPPGAAVVFSIDSDWNAVDAKTCGNYFWGIHKEFDGEFRVGAYGGAGTLSWLRENGLLPENCSMQTASWSGARRDGSGWPTWANWLDWPTMRQMTVDSVRHVSIGGVSVDLDWALPGRDAFWSSASQNGQNWDPFIRELRP